MSEKELLELAAKAYWADEIEDVGIRWSEQDQAILYIHAGNQDHNGQDQERVWNPRYNGDDALRLAAKLHIHITISDHGRTVCRQGDEFRSLEYHGGDAFDATCLAIVRAAAEIAKAMPPEQAESDAPRTLEDIDRDFEDDSYESNGASS